MDLDSRLVDAFLGRVNEIHSGDRKAMISFSGENKSWAMRYFQNILTAIIEVHSVYNEFGLIFKGLEPERHAFLLRTREIEELSLAIKTYYVTWSTLNDVMMIFVDRVFDIGMDERDISYGTIMRNSKVAASEIPTICKSHEKVLGTRSILRDRNDVIHRGRLNDEEVKNMRHRIGTISARSVTPFFHEKLSEEEIKEMRKKYYEDLKSLGERKKTELEKHFADTTVCLEEMCGELAEVAARHLNNEKI